MDEQKALHVTVSAAHTISVLHGVDGTEGTSTRPKLIQIPTLQAVLSHLRGGNPRAKGMQPAGDLGVRRDDEIKSDCRRY